MTLHTHYINGPINARTLIISHGLFGSGGNWIGIANALSDTYHVILIDNRNHGQSPHDASMSYPEMAADLHKVIMERALDNVILLGHSMGGKIVCQYTHDYPEHAAALIVADIAPKEYPHHHQEILRALNEVAKSDITKRHDADMVMSQWIKDSTVRQFLQKSLKPIDGRLKWQFNIQAITEQYSQIAAAPTLITPITIPTLFIRGERSHYIQNDDWPQITTQFTHAQCEIIHGAGHWLHAERPQDVIDKIKTFGKSLTSFSKTRRE